MKIRFHSKNKVSLEEEEYQAQAMVSLKKRMRAKKYSARVNPPKRIRTKSFPLTRGLQEVCVNFVPALSVTSFTYTCIRRRLPISLMDLIKRT